jgi:hypothetical protein
VVIAYVLLFQLWLTIGYALAVPVTAVDLMRSQTPPVKPQGFLEHAALYGIPVAAAVLVIAVAGRTRPFLWWVFLARTTSLLVFAWMAVAWAESRVESAEWSNRAFAECLAAGAVAFVHHRAVLWWDKGGLAQGRRRPAPGEVWYAWVPFRDTDETREHYCVIMGTRLRYVEVLQITSKNKDHRPDHIRIPNHGWDESSGKDHWIEIGLAPRRVPYENFTGNRPKGRCPKATWRELQARRPAPDPSSRPALWNRITQFRG